MNDNVISAIADVIGMIGLLLVGYLFGYNNGWTAGVNFMEQLKKSEREEK